jgi:glyoxylase-like metal-dependent hydrolase (beta-lactamase superfamily II)
MKIHTIPGYQFDSNIYIIDGEIPTIIDTGTGLHQNLVEKELKRLINPESLKQIILTHEHYDHCGGVEKIKNLTKNNAIIIAHEIASEKIEKGISIFAELTGGKMSKMPVDKKIKKDDTIKIGDKGFKTIYTPGHTPGCICLYNSEFKTLFSGDTIFANGSFGRYDFPGGNLKQLKESVNILDKYDIENIYPGHESTVEKEGNFHIQMSLKNLSYI